LKNTAIAASIVLAGCGLKPTASPGDGRVSEDDDFSLTKSGLIDDGGILKKPGMPTFACEDVSLPSTNIQYVPPVETRFGPLDVYLGSSSWSPQRIDGLQKAGQSALFGAGLRILGSNGAQSPLSAPWLGIDHITLTPALDSHYGQKGNMFGIRLLFDSRRLRANLHKVKSDGSVEFEIPLRLDSRSFNIKTPRGTVPALRAKLEKPLSAGSYRLVITGEMKPSVINLDIRPGDLNNSFSVDAIDIDFIARNRDLTVSTVSNQNHLLGLLKADLNSDDRLDQSDLDIVQALNPESNRINSDFLGEPLTQNPGDISKIMVRGSLWGRGFQGALGTGVGFTLAPASCLRSLPWIRMNQLLIASPSSAPVSGLVTLSGTTNGKDGVLISSSLEKLPRAGDFSVLSLRSPLKSGVYQLKISVNNATKELDGILTRLMKFRVLEGDVDGNYLVDRMDLEILRKYFNQRVNSTNIRADLDANGIINSADLIIAMSRQGLALKDPSIPPPQITEFNKVHIADENGNFLTGSIVATMNGQSLTKVELNGQDSAVVTVTGALGSKVLWSNSLTGDTFETILDGKGDYDGRGHYVVFKVQGIPDVPNLPPELPPVTEVNKVHINDGNGRMVPGIIAATINGQTVAKVELNGKDAALAQVTGPFGSKVVWTNNLSSETFETILDGKGDYGQGHYVIFKAKSDPVVPPQPPKMDDQLTWIDVTTAPNQITMKDNATGLWWSNYRSALPWEEARSNCESLNYNGKGNGWRLPNVEELKKAYANGIKSQAREGWITNFQGFWSSSPFSDRADSSLVAGWDDSYKPDFIYTNYYDKGNNIKFVCVLDPTAPPEKGGCGRFFGVTAGSFPSTKDECFMKQEDIDASCKNFSGQAYKVNWTRFNVDSTIKEVINLQSGVCMKLPAQPPSMDDQLQPDPPPQQDFTDVELGIFRQPTASKFQTCIRASVNGQPEIELVCNRPAPFQDYVSDINKSVKVRMQKGVCNILRLSMHTRQTPSEPFRRLTAISDRVFNSATRPMFGPGVIVDFGGDSYSLMGNDNEDSRWDDIVFKLRNPYPGQLQFMIEGAKGGCN
jgi:hypothetical protein